MSAKIKALNRFFASSPPLLVLSESGSKATSTRGPTEFDTHLDPGQQLKQVVYAPNLVDNISSLVDKAMNTIHLSNIPFSTKEVDGFSAGYPSIPPMMLDEASVLRFYEETTATACAQVAFGLEYHLSLGEKGIFRWSSDKSQRQNAISDGTFKLNAAAFEELRHTLSPQVRDDLGLVLEIFSDMAPWEGKSLSAAPEAFIRCIVELAQGQGYFKWICCRTEVKCGRRHYASKAAGASTTVTGARMGFDAPLPWVLPHPPDGKNRDEDSDDLSYIPDAFWEKVHWVLQQVRYFSLRDCFFDSDFSTISSYGRRPSRSTQHTWFFIQEIKSSFVFVTGILEHSTSLL